MMESQVITTLSGAVAGSGASGVTQAGGDAKGGLFALLMQAFEGHLKTGILSEKGSGGALASLLQGKHGEEITALLAKLGKGDTASAKSLLAGLSPDALAALKSALQVGDGAGADALLTKLQLVLGDAPVEASGSKTVEGGSARGSALKSDEAGNQGAAEDGSSLQVGIVAAGVRVEQSRVATGGARSQSGAGDMGHDAGGRGRQQVAVTFGAQGDDHRRARGVSAANSSVDASVPTGGGDDVQPSGRRNAGVHAESVLLGGNVGDRALHVVARSENGHTVREEQSVDRSKFATVAEKAGQRVSSLSATEMRGEGTMSEHAYAEGEGTRAHNAKWGDQVVPAAKSGGKHVSQDDGAVDPVVRIATAQVASGSAGDVGGTKGVQSHLLPGSVSGQHHPGQQGPGDHGGRQGHAQGDGAPDGWMAGQRIDSSTTLRGSDFASQLSYKGAATSWKPADAMMQIGKAAGDGAVRIDLQLEPAHLGKVTVSIQSDATRQVQLHITVDNAAGRMALDQNMGQLRSALAQQGLDLGSFSMDLASQGQQGQQERGQRSPFTRVPRDAFHIISDNVMVESGDAIGVNRVSGNGRLSVLA